MPGSALLRSIIALTALIAACAQTNGPNGPPASAASVEAHVERAQQLAGNDLKNLTNIQILFYRLDWTYLIPQFQLLFLVVVRPHPLLYLHLAIKHR